MCLCIYIYTVGCSPQCVYIYRSEDNLFFPSTIWIPGFTASTCWARAGLSSLPSVHNTFPIVCVNFLHCNKILRKSAHKEKRRVGIQKVESELRDWGHTGLAPPPTTREREKSELPIHWLLLLFWTLVRQYTEMVAHVTVKLFPSLPKIQKREGRECSVTDRFPCRYLLWHGLLPSCPPCPPPSPPSSIAGWGYTFHTWAFGDFSETNEVPEIWFGSCVDD